MPQSRSPQRPAACPPISPSPPISLGRSCVWRHIESPQPVINRLTHHDALFLLRSARATGLRQMTDCARPLLHYPCGSQSAGKHLGQVPGNLAEAEPFRKVHVC